MMYGRTVMFPPSRFLEEIPAILLKRPLSASRMGAGRSARHGKIGRRKKGQGFAALPEDAAQASLTGATGAPNMCRMESWKSSRLAIKSVIRHGAWGRSSRPNPTLMGRLSKWPSRYGHQGPFNEIQSHPESIRGESHDDHDKTRGFAKGPSPSQGIGTQLLPLLCGRYAHHH